MPTSRVTSHGSDAGNRAAGERQIWNLHGKSELAAAAVFSLRPHTSFALLWCCVPDGDAATPSRGLLQRSRHSRHPRVSSEPVSEAKFPASWENTGNFALGLLCPAR